LLGVAGLLLSGCIFDQWPRPSFEVVNLTAQELTLERPDGQGGIFQVSSGGTARILVTEERCDSRGWVATFDSGTIVAQVPGGCVGHRWTIRGVNDSTYE
jgi:hypothetical protein